MEFLFFRKIVCAVTFVLGGIVGTGSVGAQGPERHPVPALAKLLFEKTMSQPYIYESGKRRDPFVPLQVLDPSNNSDGTEVIESGNPDDELTLLGIISGKRGYRALVRLPNGKHVMVGPGSLLEKNAGRVTRITGSTVVIARLPDGKDDNRTSSEKIFMLSH